MRRMVVIIFILLASMIILAVVGSKECNPSVLCGNQSISSPFTLKGDPSSCSGDEKYRLSCIGNKTFMAAPYDKYHVLNIFYNNRTIKIVHTDSASGKCNLPSQIMTPNFFPKGFYQGIYFPPSFFSDEFNNFNYRDEFSWVGFVNCSEKPAENPGSDFSIQAIPCLSHKDRVIYVAPSGQIESLPISCSYLTIVPVMLSDGDPYNIGDNIFNIMKNGISISWGTREIMSRPQIIRYCLASAVPLAKQKTVWSIYNDRFKFPFRIELEFVYCMEGSKDSIMFGSSIVFVVFFDIIFLYSAIIMSGRLIIAPLCVHLFLLYELLKMLSPVDHIENFLRNQQKTTLTRYVYADIVAITSHFKDRLGQGGFGTVYKGELPGAFLVAVKLLGKSNDNGEDFISEVSTIGTIHHTNVVRLIGFCSEGLHRALVYEYMYNGSLDKYIFSSTQKFTTTKLNEIAIGVARGIDYLHRGCDMRILHFDIKPHNILLDSNFSPKVSDFGLAKLYSKDNSLVSTFAARGTIGYIAPELISRSFGLISYKSDVYSFGMLLLEMAGGRRNYDSRAENSSEAYYPSWIYDQLEKTTNLEVLDHEIEPVDIEMKLCKVGLWCIQMSPSSRPTMLRVLEMLEGDVTDIEMPPKPFFFGSSDHTTMGHNSFQLFSNEISTIYESE